MMRLDAAIVGFRYRRSIGRLQLTLLTEEMGTEKWSSMKSSPSKSYSDSRRSGSSFFCPHFSVSTQVRGSAIWAQGRPEENDATADGELNQTRSNPRVDGGNDGQAGLRKKTIDIAGAQPRESKCIQR